MLVMGTGGRLRTQVNEITNETALESREAFRRSGSARSGAVNTCRTSILFACPCPSAGENRDPVTTGIVTGWTECKRLALVPDRVGPGPQRVGVLAEAAVVAVRVRRVLDSGAHLQAPVRAVASFEEQPTARRVVQLPPGRTDPKPPAAGRWWLV